MGSNVKQVIVMRTQYPDGKGGTMSLRKGKMIAQGSHASQMFLSEKLREHKKLSLEDLSPAEREWISGSFAKVVVYVKTEKELLEIHLLADAAGLISHLVTDSGFTEFHGVATKTAIAIGPDYSERIDGITGDLPLL